MRNTKEIRDFLVKQMTDVATGDLEVGRAKAVCNFAQQIYNTTNLELRLAVAKKEHPDLELESVEWQ